MRGMLTNEIQEKAKAFLGREISVRELRLYPYIDFSIKNKNCQGWSYAKLSKEEFPILNRLSEEGHLLYSPEKVIVSRKFYSYMQEVLAIGYVESFLEV